MGGGVTTRGGVRTARAGARRPTYTAPAPTEHAVLTKAWHAFRVERSDELHEWLVAQRVEGSGPRSSRLARAEERLNLAAREFSQEVAGGSAAPKLTVFLLAQATDLLRG